MTAVEDVLTEVKRVMAGGSGDIQKLPFRDPSSFLAGSLQNHLPLWSATLTGNSDKGRILNWLSDGVDVKLFMKPFKGLFKGVKYDSPMPPRKVFKNHGVCNQFEDFITQSLLQRLSTGAIRVWGKVGEVSPPWLVLPMTVEPNKPRLCVDARFLNLWMKDTPFSLETLVLVPRIAYRNCHFSKIDDKSGYDHILISADSQQFLVWNGWDGT